MNTSKDVTLAFDSKEANSMLNNLARVILESYYITASQIKWTIYTNKMWKIISHVQNNMCSQFPTISFMDVND